MSSVEVASGIDLFGPGAASLRHQVDHLAGPLGAGAVVEAFVVGPDGAVTVDWTREPLLMVGLCVDLDDEGLLVDAVLDDGGGATTSSQVHFAPWSEAGCWLPMWWEAAEPLGRHLDIALAGRRGESPGTEIAVGQLSACIELVLVQGRFGRLLYACSAEKARLRRMAREVARSRLLDHARRDALDRHGRDLGVPRLSSRLAAAGTEIVTETAAEADDHYRARLRLYRSLRLNTPAAFASLVNGSDQGDDLNHGPLLDLRPPAAPPLGRFAIEDAPAPMSTAIRLVSVGDADARAGFLTWVRRDHLVRPLTIADADHRGRLVPAGEREHVEDLRATLRRGFDFRDDAATDPGFARGLAEALARVAACREELGAPRWALHRAQFDGGSRYELGLGADLALPSAAELDALARRATAFTPSGTTDPAVARVLSSASPAPSSEDSEGRWLLEACGLLTVHRTAADRLYVSHLRTQGLVIDGAATFEPAGWDDVAVSHGYVILNDRAQGVLDLLPLTTSKAQPRQLTVEPGSVTIPLSEATDGRIGLYHRPSGRFQILHLNHGLEEDAAEVGTQWTAVRAGFLLSEAAWGVPPQIVLYDTVSGDLQVHRFTGDGLRLRDRFDAWRPGWTHLVTGRLRPTTEERSSRAQLACYDAVTGTFEVFDLTGPTPRVILSMPDWRAGWTHVELIHSGRSASVDGNLVVAFDSATRELAVYRANGEGAVLRGLERLGTSRLSEDWTVLVGHPDLAWSGLATALVANPDTGRTAMVLLTDPAQPTTYLLAPGWRPRHKEPYAAHVYGPGDAPADALLVTAMADAATSWQAQGHAPWTPVAAGDLPAVIGSLRLPTPAAAIGLELARMPYARSSTALEPIGFTPDELIAAVRLDAALGADIDQGVAVDRLRALLETLSDSGLASAFLFLAAPGEAIVVTSVISLPIAGTNLANRAAADVHWYVVPVVGDGGSVRRQGVTTEFSPNSRGLVAMVAVAGHDRAGPAPFEVRIEPPAGAVLSLDEYEFLMNLLQAALPAAVQVNTFAVRRTAVDVDDDGAPEPLPPRSARTFRNYRAPSRVMMPGRPA